MREPVLNSDKIYFGTSKVMALSQHQQRLVRRCILLICCEQIHDQVLLRSVPTMN